MDHVRALYTKNTAQLRQMLTKAEATGRKVNGYTAEQLRAHVASYAALSVATDAELTAHFAQLRVLMAARLAALKAGDMPTFQATTTQIADRPMAGVLPLTAADKTRYANRKGR